MIARVRRLGWLIQRPADIWLICRMAAWGVCLPALKHIVPLDRLARLMWDDPEQPRMPDPARISKLSRLLTRPTARLRGGCYERSLLAYRFLSQGGADPRLVVAVKPNGGAVTGHAWVTVDGRPIDESEALEGFIPVTVYGRGGRPDEERA